MIGYVEQHPDFALGNFINCTPAIRHIHEQTGQPVPVYFATTYVRLCYVHCDFIDIIGEPKGNKLFSSKNVCPDESMPDYKYIFRNVTGNDWSERYHTYIDNGIEHKYSNKHVLFINGSGVEDRSYIDKKDPKPETYSFAREYINDRVIFTGSREDISRMTTNCYDTLDFGNIRRSLALIRTARYIIANDSGLAHAAGAMNKPVLILWKDTKPVKNQNPGKGTVYSYGKDNWRNDIVKFIDKQEETLKELNIY